MESTSPKSAVKEFFTKGYVDETHYQLLIQVIDDRNLLSHLYEEEDFETIHQRLGTYEALMQKVLQVILSKMG